MEELIIQSHDFEKSKNQLKKFSEETLTDLEFKKVDSGKGVGEFLGDFLFGRGIGTDHKVTGDELNSLTEEIQGHLISINNMQRDFIGEIGHVYSALESLDKDYIQSILIALKSAQKANTEVKFAQKDIEQTIEEQKKIVKVLQLFKEKLDKYKHIIDIDEMWSEFQAYQKESLNIQQSLFTLQQYKESVSHLFNEVQSLKDTKSNFDKTRKFLIKEDGKLLNCIKKAEKSFAKKIMIAYALSGGAIGIVVIELVLAKIGLI